jgi:hypothetical protein
MGAFEQGPWEAERITPWQVMGGTHTVLTDAVNFVDGQAMRFRANSTGTRFVTYRVPISETGNYEVAVRVRTGSTGALAKLQWSPNGSSSWTDVGPVEDFYTPSTDYSSRYYFPPTLSTVGQIYFRWLVSGHNMSSSNYDVVTDNLILLKF